MIDSQIEYFPYTNCIFVLHYTCCVCYITSCCIPSKVQLLNCMYDRDTDLNLVKATYQKSTNGSFCLVE